MPGELEEQGNLFTTDMTQEGPYRDFRMSSGFETDFGIIQVPVANGPCELIAVHTPVSQRSIAWVAVRQGSPPRVPLASRVLDGGVLLRTRIGSLVPMVGVDGLVRSYAVAGVYTYAMKNPLMPGDPIPTGASPTDSVTASMNTFPANLFDASLAGGGGPLAISIG